MSKEAIIQLLEQAGLEQYKQAIASWIYPTAQLMLESVSDVSIPIGSSKVGGNPDLPKDMEWPRWKDYEMTFISQINLAEIPAELSLPTTGLLSFFYAVEPMFKDKDFFFGDPQTCRVIFTEAGRLNQISRRNTPDNLKESARMRSNRISFETGLSVPAPESSFLESLGLGWNGNQEDFEKYWGGFCLDLRIDGKKSGILTGSWVILIKFKATCSLVARLHIGYILGTI